MVSTVEGLPGNPWFIQPQGRGFDSAGNLYVTDGAKDTARKGVPHEAESISNSWPLSKSVCALNQNPIRD